MNGMRMASKFAWKNGWENMDEDYVLKEAEEIVREREKLYQKVPHKQLDLEQVSWVCEVCGHVNHLAALLKCEQCGN